MSTPAGYSGTPLPGKLGLKPGMRLLTVDPPANIDLLLDGAPAGLIRINRLGPFDCALVFATTERALSAALATLEPKLAADGMIWAAWPKKASGIVVELTEAAVMRIGLATGLVDVKVCAIDPIWSGLKFVRRLRDRARAGGGPGSGAAHT